MECAEWLSSGANVVGGHVTVAASERDMALFTVNFDPPPALTGTAIPGRKGAHLLVPAFGDPVATPAEPERPWRHIYPRAPLSAPTGQTVPRVSLAHS